MANIKVKRYDGNSEKILAIVDGYYQDSVSKGTIPLLQDIALLLEVDVATVSEWQNKHIGFAQAIKKVKTRQEAHLLKIAWDRDWETFFIAIME